MEKSIANLNAPILHILNQAFPKFDETKLLYTNVIIPKEQAWGTYKIRYNNNIERKSIKPNSLQLYKSALEQLQNFNEDNVSIHVFRLNSDRGLIVFSDIDDRNVIGYYTL